jgi:hypothetical protein
LEDCAITQLQQLEVTEMVQQVAQRPERRLPGRRPDATSRVGALDATNSARRQQRKQTIHTLQAVVSAAVVVGVFAFAVPKIASYGSA